MDKRLQVRSEGRALASWLAALTVGFAGLVAASGIMYLAWRHVIAPLLDLLDGNGLCGALLLVVIAAIFAALAWAKKTG